MTAVKVWSSLYLVNIPGSLDALPSMTNDRLDRSLAIGPVELYFHFGARLDRANPAGQLVRGANSLMIELGNNIARLEPCEIRRTVIDYPAYLQTPPPCVADAATPRCVADPEKPEELPLKRCLMNDRVSVKGAELCASG